MKKPDKYGHCKFKHAVFENCHWLCFGVPNKYSKKMTHFFQRFVLEKNPNQQQTPGKIKHFTHTDRVGNSTSFLAITFTRTKCQTNSISALYHLHFQSTLMYLQPVNMHSGRTKPFPLPLLHK